MYAPQHAHIPPTDLQQVVDAVSGPLYHQQQVTLPPPHYQSSTNIGVESKQTNNNNNGSGGYTHSYQPVKQTPSTNDSPPTTYQLADFATNMIYLLWHVRQPAMLNLHMTSKQHNYVSAQLGNFPALLLSKESNSAFRTFCQQVLAATQLSESVVILGLKYIAKLLDTNPYMQGADGSEYRLFIVSLLLANKFNDDNTFTNKSWSDISGMKLHELNVMELELLTAVDYRLFIRKEEFDHWKAGLLSFMAQLQNASMMQEQQQQQMIDSSLCNTELFLPATLDPASNTSSNNNNNNNNAALTQQQQQQYFYLLSTTVQPELQMQLLNTPVARVPLRIPPYPVYMPVSSTNSIPSTASTTPTISLPPPDMVPTNTVFPSSPSSALSPFYQQTYTNTHLPTESSYYDTPQSCASAIAMPPNRSPQPALSMSSIPKNYSSFYLTPLNNNDNNATRWNSMGLSDQQQHHHAHHHQQHQHHHRVYRPYQRPAIHTDDQRPFMDYYTCKTLNAGKMNSNSGPPNNKDRLLVQQQRSTRPRSYSNPFPSHLRQQQQTTKLYPHQQCRQPSHDDYIYQDYQQTGTDPSCIQHDRHLQQEQQQQQQYQHPEPRRYP
ncbi:hypothetical protein BC941DRAFT_408023 [Chlamydoabsidia padenii]|nr:hypothetical protein BC941DRAFT_408023 [Chlamydoabsidia padenii]